MSTRTRASDEGRRLADRIRRAAGDEIRSARMTAGLSQRAAAAAAGMSHAQFGRIERAMLPGLTVDQACRAGFAVGLRVATRLYPDGDPVRDAGQLRLLERFRARVPPGIEWRAEVPMAIPGDRRAWDAVLAAGGRRAGCEAETRLGDLQALERRLALKIRDGNVDVLILVVADTAANRATLDRHRESLRTILPADGRRVLSALRDGRIPDASGIVVL